MKLILLMAVMVCSFNVFAFDAGKYFTKTCTICHTIGGGDKIGPDLAGLSSRRKVDWIVKFVKYPDGMINGDAEEAGYEKADETAKKVYELYKPQMMADQELSKVQVEAILKWIDAQKKQPKGKILKLIGKAKKAKK
jgi:protein SCO1/2